MSKVVKKAVFPVGGLGTRFLPATKSMPKEMLPVVDKPLIHYAYDEAVASGLSEYVFVTGRNKASIENHFDQAYELQSVLLSNNKHEGIKQTKGWLPDPGCIFFTRQQEPLGLGHAVWCARNVVQDEPFAVLLADDLMMCDKTPAIAQLLEVYYQTGGNVIALQKVAQEDVSKFGVIDPESINGNVIKAKGIVEKPAIADAPSDLCVVGRYILRPEIFKYLEKRKAGAGGEIQLTDAISEMMSEVPLYGVILEGNRYDCGDKIGFLEANIAFALARPEMRDKVRQIIEKAV
jgi:UTP--glucose-1-phosphate uridylyltransferase